MNKREKEPNICGCRPRGVNHNNHAVLVGVNGYFIVYSIYQLKNGCLAYIIITCMHSFFDE
jgi:hypothetical protein